MAFYAAVMHRGKNYQIAGLIETAFETEEAARSGASRDQDQRHEETIITVFEAADLQAAKAETIRRGIDWRWQPESVSWQPGRGKLVEGKTLRHHNYRTYSPTWNHDHCYFCWRRFMDPTDPANKPEWFADGEIATVGYGTVAFGERSDDYYWICEACFQDFDPFFHWTVIEGEKA